MPQETVSIEWDLVKGVDHQLACEGCHDSEHGPGRKAYCSCNGRPCHGGCMPDIDECDDCGGYGSVSCGGCDDCFRWAVAQDAVRALKTWPASDVLEELDRLAGQRAAAEYERGFNRGAQMVRDVHGIGRAAQ